MKTKFLMLLALSFSTMVFAQKRELRSVEKSIKSGSFSEAQAEISTLSGMLSQMDEKEKEEFYFLKGQAYLGAEGNKDVSALKNAMEAFNKVNEYNNGKNYGEEAKPLRQRAMNGIITNAIDDQNAERYKEAAEKLHDLYTISPKDTVYLYYAASNAVNGMHYDMAIEYYNRLKEMGYRGVETQYLATEKESGEVETFGSASQRDLFVKAGTHIKPETVKTPPKSAEIARNIALIYMAQDKNEQALQAMKDARAENPDDDDLLRSQADIFLKLDMTEEYEKAMNEVIQKDPNNPDLYFNLGVAAAKAGNPDKAIQFYKKALEIAPDYSAANLNIAATILDRDREIIDKMNSLGNTAADNKKYDQYKNERLELYKESVPYLEKAVGSDPENIEAVRTLYNINIQLGNQEKAKQYKAQLDALEGGE